MVADDDFVKASRSAEKQEGATINGINWAKIGEVAIKTVMGGTGVLITEVTREAYKAWSRARESGVQIIQVGKKESKVITFPLGHPRAGLLYIGHPAVPNTYYTTGRIPPGYF